MNNHRLSCIVVCVGRAEYLRQTLAHNAALVDELVVVTTPRDTATIELVTQHNLPERFVGLRCSNQGDLNDAAFNKGALLNEGLKQLESPDWLLFTDADVFLNPKVQRLREYDLAHLDRNALYGTHRINMAPADVAEGMASGTLFTEAHLRRGELQPTYSQANGYFQLWHAGARCDWEFQPQDKPPIPHTFIPAERWPRVMSEAFCSAGGIDSWFQQQFQTVSMIPGLAVVHINHTQREGSSWNGGEKRAGTWRQCGLLSSKGWFQTEKIEGDSPVVRMRLTETLDGESIDAEWRDGHLPDGLIADNGENGLLFNGRDIRDCHVHVAYWCER